jgi:outer membrane usher protein FimD/PapC
MGGLWVAEDVGGAAPANSKVDEKTLTLEGDTEDGVFSLSKPTNGWPAGTYRLDIYLNDKLSKTEEFTIGSDKVKEAEESEEPQLQESPEPQEPGDSDFAFKVHNTTKNQITKLLASEDGEKYAPFDVGSGHQSGSDRDA